MNLESIEFDVKLTHKVLEQIKIVRHQFLCNLFGQYLSDVFLRLFKVWEQENKDFSGTARDLHQVNHATHLVEIAV